MIWESSYVLFIELKGKVIIEQDNLNLNSKFEALHINA